MATRCIVLVMCGIIFGYLDSALCKSEISDSLTNLSQLQFDENNRLAHNYMLYEKCFASNELSTWYSYVNPNFTVARQMKKVIGNVFRQDKSISCLAVCVGKGILAELIQYPLSKQIYSRGVTSLKQWMDDCENVEFGIITPNDDRIVNLSKLKENGSSNIVLTFEYGAENTQWAEVLVGTGYEMLDARSDALLGKVVVENSGVIVLSPEKFREQEPNQYYRENINATFSNSWRDAQSVRWTFSSHGFEKSRLPMDLWSLLSTYHYNNRDKFVPEERNAIIINPHTSTPSHLLELPPRTISYVRGRLRELMEEWIGGVQLDENGVLYGIRRYARGTRLLTHTDHMTTHAVAMIINIDQDTHASEPWKLEIYDFHNRLHEITMHPGDVLYYEAVRCLHGRMSPLNGSHYSNLFAHFFPRGDLDWASKDGTFCSSPRGRTEAKCMKDTSEEQVSHSLIADEVIGGTNGPDFTRDTENVPCSAHDCNNIGLEKASSWEDLYSRWKSYSPPGFE